MSLLHLIVHPGGRNYRLTSLTAVPGRCELGELREAVQAHLCGSGCRYALHRWTQGPCRGDHGTVQMGHGVLEDQQGCVGG
eukprot:40993-Eustigmatos_ZCMA.PRE.1